MDDNLSTDREFVIDIESCRTLSEEAGSSDTISDGKLGKTYFTNVSGGSIINFHGSVNGENGVNLFSSIKNGGEVSPENMKVFINKEVEGVKAADLAEFNKMRNERRKTTSAKKPPKPPRPPRGLSLDAADQKLIKEIAELALMKRARIERMKALKKMKAAKASSVSSSSGSFFAMLFTILFCLVIVFQGMSCRNSSALGFHGSPESVGSVESLITVQYHKSLSTNDATYTGSESPNLVEQVSGFDPDNKVKRATG